MSPQTNTIPDWAIRAAHKAYETPIRDDASLVSLVSRDVSDDVLLCIAKAIHDAVMAERAMIVARLLEEAELTPCGEDAMVTRSIAFLIKADFSYEEAERLSEKEEA